MIWFTSDWHFGHDKDFAWGGPRNCISMADNSMKIVIIIFIFFIIFSFNN